MEILAVPMRSRAGRETYEWSPCASRELHRSVTLLEYFGQSRLQHRPRDLDHPRTLGKYQCGANRFFRVNAAENGAVERELADIGFRHVGEARRNGAVGLVIGDHDRVARD